MTKSKLSMTEFFRRLEGTKQRLRQQRESIGKFLLYQIDQRFETEGRSGGHVWKAKKIPNGYKILGSQTNKLRRSFRPVVTDKFVTAETDVPYARIHLFGTEGAGGMLPSIKPKDPNGKLFIPLSQKARNQSIRFSGGKPRKMPLEYGEDYVLVKSVDIPARPFFPSSQKERKALSVFIARVSDPLNKEPQKLMQTLGIKEPKK